MKPVLPLALAIVLLGAAQYAAAQTGAVRGVVKDHSGRPIKGATIALESQVFSSRFVTTTDKKGRFAVIGLGSGEWLFIVEAPGFEPVVARADIRALQRNPEIEIRLLNAAVPSSLGMTGREIQQRIDAAEAAAERGELDAAIAAYTDLVARVPALTAVYLQLGVLQERKGDMAAALASYRRLADIEPRNAKALASIERLKK